MLLRLEVGADHVRLNKEICVWREPKPNLRATKSIGFSSDCRHGLSLFLGKDEAMNKLSILSLSATTALGLALCSSSAAAQSAKDIVGTWTIVSAEAFGPTPKGVLIFDANARYSLMLMRPDLPRYASNNRTQGTPEEYKAVSGGSISYFGTYSVSGSDLILRVEYSSFPNWNGTEQKRTNFTLAGDELKYTNTAPSVGGPAAVLVWKRAK